MVKQTGVTGVPEARPSSWSLRTSHTGTSSSMVTLTLAAEHLRRRRP
jgi:hypothetical protein